MSSDPGPSDPTAAGSTTGDPSAGQRPIRNATSRPGAVTRCYKAMCAVCGRTDIYDGHDKERDVWPQLREHGWKQTRKLTEGDSRHWICSKHHEPGSYKVYRDKEIQRVELGPGDVPGLG